MRPSSLSSCKKVSPDRILVRAACLKRLSQVRQNRLRRSSRILDLVGSTRISTKVWASSIILAKRGRHKIRTKVTSSTCPYNWIFSTSNHEKPNNNKSKISRTEQNPWNWRSYPTSIGKCRSRGGRVRYLINTEVKAAKPYQNVKYSKKMPASLGRNHKSDYKKVRSAKPIAMRKSAGRCRRSTRTCKLFRSS